MNRLRNFEFRIYTPELLKSVKDGKRIIEGYASVSDIIDRQNEVITNDALIAAEKDLLENSTVFYEHKHSDLPIGKVIESNVDDSGLRVKVELTQAKFADDIWKLIQEGILNSFSIGGEVKQAHDRKTKDGKIYRQIDELILYEVSIVGLPANSDAKFALAKALKKNVKDLDLPCINEHSTINKFITKALRKLEPKLTFDQALSHQIKKLTFDQMLAKDLTSDKLIVKPKKEQEKIDKEEVKCPNKCTECERIKPESAKEQNKDVEKKDNEVISKPEETEDYIRIPVRTCSVTATIDISVEKGIKALYCGKIKKIATYLFAKAKGWTMKTAMQWVKEHDSGKEKAKKEPWKVDLAAVKKTLIDISSRLSKVEDIIAPEKPSEEQPVEEVPAGEESREQKSIEKKNKREIPERKSLKVVKSPYGEESQPKVEKKEPGDQDWSLRIFR